MYDILPYSYAYDGSGNLVEESQGSLPATTNMTLTWTADGKVEKIDKFIPDGSIEFLYDATGSRVLKKVVSGSAATFTNYVRDANGEVIAIYRAVESATADTPPQPLEWHIYGSESHGLFGTAKPEEEISYSTSTFSPSTTFTRDLRYKDYVLKDHLGNVRVVFSDLKLDPYSNGIFSLDLVSASHYYPFGMLQPERSWQSEEYRYGFNNMEKDDEIAGVGNSYTTLFRQYDPRLGRWWSIDPKIHRFPSISPYSSMTNNPISIIDPNGDIITNALQEKINWVNEEFYRRSKMFEGENLKELNDEWNDFKMEIEKLDKSDVIYDYGVTIFPGDPGDIGGKIYYDTKAEKPTVKANIRFSLSSIQTVSNIAHEVKHMYQFEVGDLSFTKDGTTGGLLHDPVDEWEAYERSSILGGWKPESINDLLMMKDYNNLTPEYYFGGETEYKLEEMGTTYNLINRGLNNPKLMNFMTGDDGLLIQRMNEIGDIYNDQNTNKE